MSGETTSRTCFTTTAVGNMKSRIWTPDLADCSDPHQVNVSEASHNHTTEEEKEGEEDNHQGCQSVFLQLAVLQI